MKFYYSQIKLPGNEFGSYKNSEEEAIESIGNLSKVNIFVGENNSGKSRFMRSLMKLDYAEFNANNPDTKKYLSHLKEIREKINTTFEGTYGKGINEFRIDQSQFSVNKLNFAVGKYFSYNNNHELALSLLESAKAYVYGRMRLDVISSSSPSSFHIQSVINELKTFADANQEKIDFIKKFHVEKIDFKKVYIPILRSLNSFHDRIEKREDFRDFYHERVNRAYGFGIENKELDKRVVFTGQDLYYRIRSMLLGDQKDREKVRKYENFLSERIYNNVPVSITPKEKSDVLSIKIGNAPEREIHELGDGIQGLIMLTFPLLEYDNALFFIEEPELNLHPGMQRKFVELLLQDKLFEGKNHQYFLTTHSNHLLDLTLDHKNISIYKFAPLENENKKMSLVNFGDQGVLRELGVKNSSVFLSNATIWVEGITDRLYLRKYLELYQAKYPKLSKIYEDVDYSFVEYGGGNITHWSFLESSHPSICIDRLCSKSFLITDKDGKNKIPRRNELKKKLGNRYACLSCLEIENLLSLPTLEKVIKKYPTDREFIMPSFRETYPHKEIALGKFIDDKLKPKNKYRGDSGTLLPSKKLDFCMKAIEDMQIEEVSRPAWTVAKNIYDFIISQRTL